jgi:hypothetical protein
MPGLRTQEPLDLINRYLERDHLEPAPLQAALDDLFDDPEVRERIGELIAKSVLGPLYGT